MAKKKPTNGRSTTGREKNLANKRKLPRYPWDKWFAKNSFRVTRGKHYHCQPHSMAVQVRTAAGKRSLSVSVSISEDTITTRIYR